MAEILTEEEVSNYAREMIEVLKVWGVKDTDVIRIFQRATTLAMLKGSINVVKTTGQIRK